MTDAQQQKRYNIVELYVDNVNMIAARVRANEGVSEEQSKQVALGYIIDEFRRNARIAHRKKMGAAFFFCAAAAAGIATLVVGTVTANPTTTGEVLGLVAVTGLNLYVFDEKLNKVHKMKRLSQEPVKLSRDDEGDQKIYEKSQARLMRRFGRETNSPAFHLA